MVVATFCGAFSACGSVSSTETLVALRADATSPVELGVWHASLDKTRAYAEENGVPLIAVWSNGDYCSHCRVFQDACTTSEFRDWMKTSGCAFLFVHSGDLGGQQGGAVFNWCYDGTQSVFPFVRMYWPRGKVDVFTNGDNLLGQSTGITGANKVIANLKKALKGYVPDPIPITGRSEFGCPDSNICGLQSEIGLTTEVLVPLTRTNANAVVAAHSFAYTNLVATIYPDGFAVTNSIAWDVGEAQKSIAINTAEHIGAGGLFGGEQITLVLCDETGVAYATNHITIVEPIENSSRNPFWVGEKTSETLAFGEWTMDIDIVTNKVATFNAAQGIAGGCRAYSLVMVTGSLWCPDCIQTDRLVLEDARFKNWAVANNVALCAVDIPNYSYRGASATSLLSYDVCRVSDAYVTGRDAWAADESMRLQSGTPYLSRHMISPEDAMLVAERNRALVGSDVLDGGFRRPESANQYRTGVPTFLLLKDDGSVAGRITWFAAQGTDGWTDQYLMRFDELLAMADSEDGEDDDGCLTTKSILELPSTVTNTLSAIDSVDCYRVPLVEGRLVASVESFDVDAPCQGTLQIVAVSNGVETIFSSATFSGPNTAVAIAFVDSDKEVFVRVRADTSTSDSPQYFKRDSGTLAPYALSVLADDKYRTVVLDKHILETHSFDFRRFGGKSIRTITPRERSFTVLLSRPSDDTAVCDVEMQASKNVCCGLMEIGDPAVPSKIVNIPNSTGGTDTYYLFDSESWADFGNNASFNLMAIGEIDYDSPANNYFGLSFDFGDEAFPEEIVVAEGAPVGQLPTPVRKGDYKLEGYRFLGWFTEDGYKVTAETILDAGVEVLHPRWQPTVTLVFDANCLEEEWQGSMQSITIDAGATIEVPECQFRRDGRTFRGWASSRNGSIAYLGGEHILLQKGRRLYAIWDGPAEYQVDEYGYLVDFVLNGAETVKFPCDVTKMDTWYFENMPESLFDTNSIPCLRMLDGWVVGVTSDYWDIFENGDNTAPMLDLDLTNSKGVANGAISGLNRVSSVKGVTQSLMDNGILACCGTNLFAVSISDGATCIRSGAFNGLEHLSRISIPDSIKRIECNTFDGCAEGLFDTNSIPCLELVDGWIVGLSDDYWRLYGDGQTAYSLNIAGARGVADYALSGALQLTSIIIPATVKAIGCCVFDGCSMLTNIVFMGDRPDIDDMAFYGLPSDCVISVYPGTKGWEESDVNGYAIQHLRPVDVAKFESGGDVVWTRDAEGVWRSGKIGNESASWMEMTIEGRAIVSFRWKASSEHYDGEVFDYAYLSVDGERKGRVFHDETTDRYVMEGIAVGGECDWTAVSVEVTSPGAHKIRWTYIKDEIDESDAGEDCVWVEDINVNPLYVASFDIAGADGNAPKSLIAMDGENVTLPSSNGFQMAKHTFVGWEVRHDGADDTEFYEEGDEWRAVSDVVFTAVWNANTLAAPGFWSDDVEGGGEFDGAFATIEIWVEDADARIYYTVDGRDPAACGALYDGPFVADGLDVTIRAIAVKDDFFDSEIVEFSFTRLPYSPLECLNVDPHSVSVTESDSTWTRVLGGDAHDGVAALRSGAIGDSESSVVEMTVAGAGEISFWWKVSSEISRGRKYDYVSFSIDGLEQAWLGGEKDWTNETFSVVGDGLHSLKWIYQKNDNELTQGEDCAWLDEVTWTPSGATKPFPALATDVAPETVAAAFSGAADAGLAANVVDGTNYNAFCEWAARVKGASGSAAVGAQTVKESAKAWLSYALGADRLIAKEPTSDDVKIESFVPTSTDGKFEFTVSVKDVNIGAGSVAEAVLKENLKKVLGIEGAASLTPAAFSSDNIDITFDTPQNGKARFTATPPSDAGTTFFMRVKVK